MSKLKQSIGEMFGAVLLRLDCRLCLCTEMDGDRAPLPIACLLPARGINWTGTAIEIGGERTIKVLSSAIPVLS